MTAVERLLADDADRSPRADARRNLERLVAAARAALAEVGVEVTAQEIARRAGVGKGTFYRRIPSREILLEAVLAEVLAEALAVADRALTRPDPGQGFREFATAYVRLRAESCGVNEALGGAGFPGLDGVLSEIRSRLRQLVERAQAAGAMRPDIDWADVAFVLAGVTTDPHTIGLRADDRQWERNLAVVLDGLSGAPC
ncbi:TetR/AcrR family transcriptional regulator [Nocardia sp. alder85J]|uniref:TetR/AcrR family transcriptional regulator n=1 Tax=Nocardia sp. alder85J TaxID=2862949 RepID=UPI001CD3244C|nr:TetR/AcrR family transcriptional regulator [Nocardia sp. alder85J]MCX4092047.1 TetR/AcrR family transcriptional regulator [Nocardia sp. alder85J]